MSLIVEFKVEDHMPALYGAAERTAAEGQARFRRLIASSLALLVVAAVGGMVDRSWGGWLSAAAFAGSVVVTALWMVRRAENDWYDGRAGAESTKSMTWKFAVGGEPYGVDACDAKTRYGSDVDAVVSELNRLGSSLRAPPSGGGTDALADLRSASLDGRRAVYREQRVNDQRQWYARRAGEHRASARRWQVAMVCAQILGIAGAVLKGVDVVHADLLALLATVAAAITAWMSAADYLHIARAYDFAAIELDAVLSRIGDPTTEAEWAAFVADAEQAMSREHGMWLARKRGRL
jgi:hypothetical protein